MHLPESLRTLSGSSDDSLLATWCTPWAQCPHPESGRSQVRTTVNWQRESRCDALCQEPLPPHCPVTQLGEADYRSPTDDADVEETTGTMSPPAPKRRSACEQTMPFLTHRPPTMKKLCRALHPACQAFVQPQLHVLPWGPGPAPIDARRRPTPMQQRALHADAS